MGVDFIRKAAKSFHKGLDQSRIDLCTPDLFTRRPDSERRSYAASIRTNRKLVPGEDLCVRFHDGKVVAQRGMDIVAVFEAPPAELVEAIKESYGEACGTVQEVYEIADTAEITVC
ncbi:MAG: hypothetical protein QNJ84_03350 [Alphaproteobacteria bacterium]|nr:hypothetical protein [Alphaproteobacteria bacterium]